MAILRQNPYLWWHLAGVATLPLWLDGCLAGLAVGDPAINVGVEQGLLILLGITPLLGLQWFRPIYLFRVGPVALRPEALTESQTRLLTLQRSWPQKGGAVFTGLGLAATLIVLYRMAPIAAAATPLASIGRTSGWLLCAVCFVLANWFGQTAMSALGLLLARDRTLARTQPYERAKITQAFSGVWIQTSQILPKQWLEEAPTSPAPEVTPMNLDPVLADGARPDIGVRPDINDGSTADLQPAPVIDDLEATAPAIHPTAKDDLNHDAEDGLTSPPGEPDIDTLDHNGDQLLHSSESITTVEQLDEALDVIEGDQSPVSHDSRE